ncbi:hypothetical protein TrVE_jg9888 [Triparma verrucosa]|uniref:Uncharacterized protein n=1 Tax=Triparma verrucosa TaxID=1606542 RepID=A0A9W6Z981_9STRA|nr:hypothetical protein TrVE_jg9888 [Triparma verrucosa]
MLSNIFDENVGSTSKMTPSHNRSRSLNAGLSSVKGKVFGTPGVAGTPRRFGANLTNTPGNNKSNGKNVFGTNNQKSKVLFNIAPDIPTTTPLKQSTKKSVTFQSHTPVPFKSTCNVEISSRVYKSPPPSIPVEVTKEILEIQGLKKDFFTGAPQLPQMESFGVVDYGFGDVEGEEFDVEGFGEMDICDDL